MDPRSRNLEEEELLEDIIKDAPDVEPAESPSSYLNPSRDGMEVDRHEDEADGAEIAPMTENGIAPLMEKPVEK
jgi:hypothetical protein